MAKGSSFSKQALIFKTLRKRSFENNVGKEENQHFLLSILSKTEINIFGMFKLSSADTFNLDWSTILSHGKGISQLKFIFCKCFQFGQVQNLILKLVVVAFPLGAQDYGNSTMTGMPVSG